MHEIVGGELTFAPGSGRATPRNYRVSGDLIARGGPRVPAAVDSCARAFEQLAEAYQRFGLTIEALTGEPHQRLRRITALREAGRLDDSLRWAEVA